MYSLFLSRFVLKRVTANFLKALGAIWLLVEILSFFNKALTDSIWFDKNSLTIQASMFFVSFLIAIFLGWPPSKYVNRISGTDIEIEIRLMDIFDSKQGSIIIPINRFFDLLLDGAVLSTNSTQFQFLKKILKSQPDQFNLLQEELIRKAGINSNLDVASDGSHFGATVFIERGERTWYFFASTDLNENRRAVGTINQLTQSLNGLWVYIYENGNKETLTIPLVGSGSARVTDHAGEPISRNQIARLIIQSFLTRSMNTNFSNKLILAIYPSDFKDGFIDFDNLGKYLNILCSYPDMFKI